MRGSIAGPLFAKRHATDLATAPTTGLSCFRNTVSIIDSIIIWPKLVEPFVSFFCKHVIFPKLSRTFQKHEKQKKTETQVKFFSSILRWVHMCMIYGQQRR